MLRYMGRPKAANYPTFIKRMIIEACREYECILISTNPLPSLEWKDVTAHLVWDAACTRRERNCELDEDMKQIVRSLISFCMVSHTQNR
jgi:hypothetical protein